MSVAVSLSEFLKMVSAQNFLCENSSVKYQNTENSLT